MNADGLPEIHPAPSGDSRCPPVLLVVFNRIEPTRKVLAALRIARPGRIFIAGDGPRPDRPGEAEKVEALRREVLERIDWDCQVETLFRPSNLGCGRAVSEAISWFFSQVDQGIILEDDCVPDPSFFPFCAELLGRYADDPRVMMVSGDNFLFESSGIVRDSYYFSKYQMIWGWATWKRAWDLYDFRMRDWPSFRAGNTLAKLHPRFDERKFWTGIFEQMTGPNPIDTWDFQWLFTMWSNGGSCICPSGNLVSNVGYGEDATHTLHKSRNMDMELVPMEFPMRHPARIRRRLLADDITCDNYFLQARRFRYWASLPNLWFRILVDEFRHRLLKAPAR